MAVIVLWFTSTTEHLYAILYICHDSYKNGKTLTGKQYWSGNLIWLGLIMLIDRYSALNLIFYLLFFTSLNEAIIVPVIKVLAVLWMHP